jgi:catechol 2,3-dioxygenase-like lactoylglutathione lyase family enzyme
MDLSTNNSAVAYPAFQHGNLLREYERLIGARVKFRSEPELIVAGHSKGGHTAHFLDPDGITLELARLPHGRCDGSL